MEYNIKLYADMIKNMPIGLTVWQLKDIDNAKTLKLIVANGAIENFLGVTTEGILEKTIFESFPQLRETGILEICAEVIRSGMTQDLGEISYNNERVNDSLFTVKAFPISSDCVGVTFENITDRKWMEDLLQDALNYAESIVETIKEPLIVLNADLRVKTANCSFYKTFQVAEEETENKFIYDLGNGEWKSLDLRSRLQDIITKNSSFANFEVNHKFPNIGQRTMLLNARCISQERKKSPLILLAIEDITERKQAEIALQASEAKFRCMVDTAQEGIWLLDIFGNTNYVNQRMADMLGFSREEMLGKSFYNFMDTAGYLEAEYYFERRKQGIKEQHDFCFRRNDGSELWAIVSTNSMENDKGELLGIMAMITDINARKQAEDELKIFAAKLEQSNRELQDFAFVASHDLQEPLRKIQAFGDRLKTKYSAILTAEGVDYLERMQNAAKRMQTLISDLLAFSRVTTKAQPFAPVNLTQVLEEVLSDLEIHIHKVGAQIEAETLPTIDADAMQMRQLLQNLISNALKFHKPNTSPIIKINCQLLSSQQQSLYRNNSGGKLCQITVKDNGIGFDEKYTDRIFTVFQRLHGRNEYEGTGVGLAICRKIAERHNGTITAKSALGEGATFIITLPVKQHKILE